MMPEQRANFAGRFESTSVQTTVCGAQAISQAKIGDQAKA
jgi:hypothetical protein